MPLVHMGSEKMLKIRITYVKDKQKEEVEELIQKIKILGYDVLNESKEYLGRGTSKYVSKYIDIEREI